MAQVGGVTLGWLADGIVTAAADARAQDRYLAMLIERAGTPPDPEVARQVSLWREMRDLNAQLLQSLEELSVAGYQVGRFRRRDRTSTPMHWPAPWLRLMS